LIGSFHQAGQSKSMAARPQLPHRYTKERLPAKVPNNNSDSLCTLILAYFEQFAGGVGCQPPRRLRCPCV
jgi:hypothetical protein